MIYSGLKIYQDHALVRSSLGRIVAFVIIAATTLPHKPRQGEDGHEHSTASQW
jgi:hypothetical protein